MTEELPALVLTCLRRLTHLIAGVALSLAASLHAAPLTLKFDGILTFVDFEASPFFNVGDIFSGSYTFDSGAIDSNSDPSVGLYLIDASTLTIGAITFGPSPNPNSIRVLDNAPIDEYRAIGTQSHASFAAAVWSVRLRDNTDTALSSDSLPLMPPNLSAFDSKSFQTFFTIQRGDKFVSANVSGSLDNLSMVNPIPEPEIYALMMVGLGVLSVVARRRGKAG